MKTPGTRTDPLTAEQARRIWPESDVLVPLKILSQWPKDRKRALLQAILRREKQGYDYFRRARWQNPNGDLRVHCECERRAHSYCLRNNKRRWICPKSSGGCGKKFCDTSETFLEGRTIPIGYLFLTLCYRRDLRSLFGELPQARLPALDWIFDMAAARHRDLISRLSPFARAYIGELFLSDFLSAMPAKGVRLVQGRLLRESQRCTNLETQRRHQSETIRDFYRPAIACLGKLERIDLAEAAGKTIDVVKRRTLRQQMKSFVAKL